jgi:hypothetical protein
VPITVTVSYGVAGFNSLTDLGPAIETADKAMYAQRHEVRVVRAAGTQINADSKTDFIFG